MAGSSFLDVSDIQFVNSPSKDLTCPVCLEVLRDPFLTECCGHHFCSKCIGSVQRQKSECPLCKACPIKGIVDKRFKRELNEVKIYCPMRKDGCEWMGELGNLKKHQTIGELNGDCQHVRINCPNACKLVFPRYKIKQHITLQCKRRPCACPYCHYQGVYDDIVSRHYSECPNYPVTCPNECRKTKFKRSELQEHLDTCRNGTTSCPFATFGCSVKEIKRCNLKKHNESNVGQHQTLISEAILELKKENAAIRTSCHSNSKRLSTQMESRVSLSESTYLKLHNEQSVHISKISTQNKECVKELNYILQALMDRCSGVEDKLSATRKENQQLKLTLNTALSTCDNMKSELDGLKDLFAVNKMVAEDRGAEVMEMLSVFRAENKTYQDEMASKMAALQCEVSAVPQQHLKGYMMSENIKKSNWKLYLKTMAETDAQFADPVLPVILEVTGYGHAKSQRETIHTSSFYVKTAAGSYNLLLAVAFADDHMSVSAAITKGKYDKNLKWPFNGTIVVTLLNQIEDRNHYSKEIRLASDNPGINFTIKPTQCSIKYTELENSTMSYHFLMNDSLYFEVSNSARKGSNSGNCSIS